MGNESLCLIPNGTESYETDGQRERFLKAMFGAMTAEYVYCVNGSRMQDVMNILKNMSGCIVHLREWLPHRSGSGTGWMESFSLSAITNTMAKFQSQTVAGGPGLGRLLPSGPRYQTIQLASRPNVV